MMTFNKSAVQQLKARSEVAHLKYVRYAETLGAFGPKDVRKQNLKANSGRKPY
jgi:hypothetical protein